MSGIISTTSAHGRALKLENQRRVVDEEIKISTTSAHGRALKPEIICSTYGRDFDFNHIGSR